MMQKIDYGKLEKMEKGSKMKYRRGLQDIRRNMERKAIVTDLKKNINTVNKNLRQLNHIERSSNR